jgi:hypothetical protein
MRSDLQIQASRTNGSKSRGPVTEEGKLASSRNALRHGALSSCIVLPGEDEESFQSLAADLFEEHRPVGSTEEDLVEMMAAARWRRTRVWAVETRCLAKQMKHEFQVAGDPDANPAETASAAFSSLANETRTLDLMNRYESRYDRQYFRAHCRLLELQDRRIRNEPDNPPAPGPLPLSTQPVTPGVSAGISGSAKGTQPNPENTAPTGSSARLPHWLDSFTPAESIANPHPLRSLQPESPENPAVLRVASAIEQS